MTAPSNETHRLNSTITSSVTENTPIVNTPTQESKPMTAEPQPNENQADIDYLTDVINGKYDDIILDNDKFMPRFEQACERQSEKDLFYAGYNLKALDKKKAFDGLLEAGLRHADQTKKAFNATLPSHYNNDLDNTRLSLGSIVADDYHTTLFDKIQDDVATDTVPLRILQVLDENGRDITDIAQNDEPTQPNRPFDPQYYSAHLLSSNKDKQ